MRYHFLRPQPETRAQPKAKKKNVFSLVACILICLTLILNLLGCRPPGESPTTADPTKTDLKPTVVATIFPLADITRNLGGPDLKVLNLLPPGANPHTYEPTPGQMTEVAEAQLIISIGAGLDTWVDKLAQTSNKQAPSLAVAAGLALRAGDDPHIWLDPLLVRDQIAPTITRALIEIDPSNAAEYDAYLVTYQRALTTLHEEYEAILGPITQRTYISFHSSWGYLADRYQLKEVASIEPYPGHEPSAKWIKEVVKLAREHQVKTIFAEPQFNLQIAEVISKEFDGQVLLLDPLGGKEIKQRDTYLGLMRYNLAILQNGLTKGD